MPSLEFYGSLGNLRLDYTETIDRPRNASIITITAVYVMETGYYGRTITPVGAIKVNGTTALSFNYAPAVYTTATNQWINVNAPAATPVSVPHGPDGRGTATIEVAPLDGYSYFHFFSGGNYQTAITISPSSARIELTWIPQEPPVMTLEFEPVNENEKLRGWGLYVQGYSKIKATIYARTAPGLSIATYRTEFGPDDVKTEAVSTSELLTTAGKVYVQADVEDNAGLGASARESVTVIPYAPPSASGITIFRSTSQGAASETGKYFYIAATAHVSALAGYNTVLRRVRYRQRGSTTWGSWSTITGASKILGGSLQETKTYDVQLQVVDELNEVTYDLIVKTESVDFNIMRSHQGVAFGKYGEEANALEIPQGWSFMINGETLEGLLFPVGAVYWTTADSPPAILTALGTWTHIATIQGDAAVYGYKRTT